MRHGFDLAGPIVDLNHLERPLPPTGEAGWQGAFLVPFPEEADCHLPGVQRIVEHDLLQADMPESSSAYRPAICALAACTASLTSIEASMVGSHYSRLAPYRGLPAPMQDERFSASAA